MKPPPPPKKRMAPSPPPPHLVSGSGSGSGVALGSNHTPTGLVVPAMAAAPPRGVPPAPRSSPRAAGSDPRPGEAVVGNLLDGRFHVDGVLGEGGMGTVYAGRDSVDGRRVAIKVLRADFVSDSELVQRFLNEAQAAAQIGSPHICDVFGIGTAPNGAAYFVMEFLEGQSLAGLLEHERILPVRRILSLGYQIATGLSAAHAAGIVHRDLKPDNIMLVARPEIPEFAKILDFGVAKIGSARSKLTRVGSVFGTPQYMSPEQAAGTPVDLRADIYSLGILLYEMAVGSVPFDDENMMNVLTHQMFREPRAVRDVAPQVIPAELDAVVRKCLQKDPKHRFASMQELAAELERTASVLPEGQFDTVIPDSKRPFADQGPRAMSATVPELARPRRGSKLGVFLAAILTLVVCGVGTALYVQREAHEALADLPEVTAAPPPPATSRTFVLSVMPAGARVSGAAGLERGSATVGNEQRITLEIPGRDAPALRVSAAGYIERTVELRPELGSSLALVLQPEPAPHPVAGVASGPATGKKAGRFVAPPKPAPATPPAAAKPCKRVSPGVDPFATGDCQH